MKAGKPVGRAEVLKEGIPGMGSWGGELDSGPKTSQRLTIQDWHKKGDVVGMRSEHTPPSCLVGEKQCDICWCSFAPLSFQTTVPFP